MSKPAAYWQAVNRAAPKIRYTLADRAGAFAYWERARRYYLAAVERKDWQTADAQAETMRHYSYILATLDAAQGGGI